MSTILELEWSSQFTKQLLLERSFNKNNNNNNNNKETPGLNRNGMPIALHTALPSELSNDLGTDHLNHNVVFRKRKLLGKETLTGQLSLLHLASRNHKEGINAIHYGEQSWRSGDGTRLLPMCPCLDSRTDCRMWIEFVGCCDSWKFCPCGFPFSSKTNFSFDLLSSRVVYFIFFLVHNPVKRLLYIATDF